MRVLLRSTQITWKTRNGSWKLHKVQFYVIVQKACKSAYFKAIIDKLATFLKNVRNNVSYIELFNTI